MDANDLPQRGGEQAGSRFQMTRLDVAKPSLLPSPLWGGAGGGGRKDKPMPTNISSRTREFARKLRREATPVEGNLWAMLKTLRHSHGLHFRRQVPIGPFIADFACLKQRLVIEVDGASHDGAAAVAHDAGREKFLRGEGFKVLRVSNADVMRDAQSLMDAILYEVKQ